jgi:alkylation response protein AidB-like acyl-CoA dehydrogenase
MTASDGSAMGVATPPGTHGVVRHFDRFLGDPRDAASVIPIDRSVELDERREFPADAIARVDDWGLQRWYVPEAHGGELRDLLAPMLMIRSIARRDLTVAVAHGVTFLGAVGAWIAGGPITQTMAALVLDGEPVSWGLTERGRGSDLSNTATTARIGDDVVLDGEKWPINNATRGRAMTVLARTGDQAGPRALSLVLLDKRRVDAASVTTLPKVATHGTRGADISGLAMHRTSVAPEMLVGEPGHGLETVLKSLQLTRPLTTPLSVGAADHVVDAAVRFALVHRHAGRLVADLPSTRVTLGTAVADGLLAESVMYVVAREMHHATHEMALVSSLAKFLVPNTVDLLVRDVTPFLGVESQLLGVAGIGGFQKVARDNRVVGIFDGNSMVNLNMIVNEFGTIARPDEPVDPAVVVDALRQDSEPDGWLDPTRLRLVTRRGSRLLRALPGLVDLLGTHPAAGPASSIASELARVVDLAGSAPREARPSPRSFELAERIALCFGAACAIAVELAGPGAGSAASETRLTAVLERIAVRLGLDDGVAAGASAARLGDLALQAARDGRRVTVLEAWEEAP